MTTTAPATLPHWLRDVDATLPVTAQYVVHGNVRDRHLMPEGDGVRLRGTVAALWDVLQRSGFSLLFHHTPVRGLTAMGIDDDGRAIAEELLGGTSARLGQPVSYDAMVEVLQRVARSREVRCAIALDYASQASPQGDPPSPELHRLMMAALAEVHDGGPFWHEGPRAAAIYNPRFWIVDRPSDLPSWMVGGSDGIRQVPIPLPDLDTRLQAAAALLASLPGAESLEATEAAGRDVVNTFAATTEGLTLRAMMEVCQLAIDGGVPAAEVDDSVRAYRVGLVENRWKKPALRSRIIDAESVLADQVKGQPRAIRHAVDILTRSTTGLSAAYQRSGGTGPRGILFFAGPTGVGKTELAKAITRLLFGDHDAYIRFDMSEFASEHTEARLIGAPPGYTGHGAGGELTNAVRQRPFSVILFDEIEKAHPRILDKFLQILSDGRLTDGSGATVHFSESIIVFTSNLGVAEAEEQLREHPGSDFEPLITEAIRDAFASPDRLNRPELLGRIGDNIVVFDHLSRPVAEELARGFIDNVCRRVLDEQRLDLGVDEPVLARLVELATGDLSKGGRGVGMAIESVLVNPLARAVIKLDLPGPGQPARAVRLTELRETAAGIELTVS